MWILKIFLFCIIPVKISTELFLQKQMIVWNVGQGLWVTHIERHTCTHFDMGGEFYPLLVNDLCQNKENLLVLSHFDQDHIKFISQFNQKIPLCWANPRSVEKLKFFRQKIFKNLKPCKPNSSLFIIPPLTFSKEENKNSYVTQKERWLFPGDSPISQEKYWLPQLHKTKIRFLLLSHHGSKTATSKNFLRNLPNLLTTIASARQAKYNHPHPKIINRLHQHHLILLRTEIWGNLRFEQY